MKIIFFILSLLLLSCKKDKNVIATRTFKMGFQNSAPRFDNFNLIIQSLSLWTARADAAIISAEVPWKALLNGETAAIYVTKNFKDLADFYRSKNFELWIYIDPENGLDRTINANELTAVGKSIADADVQALYKRFVVVTDSIIKPDHLGLALETNLIRDAASPAIYNGVKLAANDAASEIKFRNSKTKLSVSIQADEAWGKLTHTSYQGISQDIKDFPFAEEVGFSSYPYFVFDTPKDIPQNYYSRLTAGINLPVFVSEGGWISRSVSSAGVSFVSSEELQKEYIEKHEELLSSVKAKAVFQLLFTDIELSSFPANLSQSLSYFTSIGLVDTTFQPKLALEAWDKIFKKTFSR